MLLMLLMLMRSWIEFTTACRSFMLNLGGRVPAVEDDLIREDVAGGVVAGGVSCWWSLSLVELFPAVLS